MTDEDKPGKKELIYVRGPTASEVSHIIEEDCWKPYKLPVGFDLRTPGESIPHYTGGSRLEMDTFKAFWGGRESRKQELEKLGSGGRIFLGFVSKLEDNDFLNAGELCGYIQCGLSPFKVYFGGLTDGVDLIRKSSEEIKELSRLKSDCLTAFEEVLEAQKSRADLVRREELVAKMTHLENECARHDFPLESYHMKRNYPLNVHTINGKGFSVPHKDSESYPVPKFLEDGQYDFITSGLERGNASIWKGEEALAKISEDHGDCYVGLAKKLTGE